MNILIAYADEDDCTRLSEPLVGCGYTVYTATSAAEVAQCLIDHPLPEVAILCESGTEWMAPLTQIQSRHIYIIGALPSMEGEVVQAAWDLGVDDVMQLQASPEEIVGRTHALARIAQWGDRRGADSDIHLLAGVHNLSTIRSLAELLANEFAQMVGMELTPIKVGDIPDSQYAAEIPLTLACNGVEISLGVGVQEGDVKNFSNALFGDEVGKDLIADAVREFANTAGGAVKRSAMEEGYTFSLGLPVDSSGLSPATRETAWRLTSESMVVLIWLCSRDTSPYSVAADSLREGMVLTQSVQNETGVVLFPQGTVLTHRTVARLAELLGGSELVQVAAAA